MSAAPIIHAWRLPHPYLYRNQPHWQPFTAPHSRHCSSIKGELKAHSKWPTPTLHIYVPKLLPANSNPTTVYNMFTCSLLIKPSVVRVHPHRVSCGCPYLTPPFQVVYKQMVNIQSDHMHTQCIYLVTQACESVHWTRPGTYQKQQQKCCANIDGWSDLVIRNLCKCRHTFVCGTV